MFYGICDVADRPGLVLAWYDRGTASQYLKDKPIEEKLRVVRSLPMNVSAEYSHRYRLEKWPWPLSICTLAMLSMVISKESVRFTSLEKR